MTAWKLRWIWFAHNWMMVGAAFAWDQGVYPIGGPVYTVDWLKLRAAREAPR